MSLTNLSNVQLFLNSTTLSDSDTATINLLIVMVDGIIQNYCGWNIMAQDYTGTFDGDGASVLNLPYTPVNSVTSLVVSGLDYTSTVSVDTNYGQLYFDSTVGNNFTSGTKNVVTTYNAGYVDIPNDLAYAASWLTVINFNRVSSESIGSNTDQFQDIKVSYDTVDIPIMVQRILDRYKLYPIY